MAAMIHDTKQIEPIPLQRPREIEAFDGKSSNIAVSHTKIFIQQVYNHVETTCTFYIIDMPHKVLMGNDWIKQHRVVIHTKKHTITFEPRFCTHPGAPGVPFSTSHLQPASSLKVIEEPQRFKPKSILRRASRLKRLSLERQKEVSVEEDSSSDDSDSSSFIESTNSNGKASICRIGARTPRFLRYL